MLHTNTRLNLAKLSISGFLLGWAAIIGSMHNLSAQEATVASGIGQVKNSQKPFKIKGFYIGMTRSLVHEELDRLNIRYSDSPDHTAGGVGNIGQLMFFYDKKDQLFEFDMNLQAVDELFNVSNLSLNEFVTQFQQAYSLPDMQLVDLPRIGSAWKYKNEEEGFEILIFLDAYPYAQLNKKLILGKIPLKSQRRFD